MKVYLNSYLQRNLGDDLFVHILTNRYPKHKFYSITTDTTYRNRFPGLRVFDWNYPVRMIKKFSMKPFLANRCDMALTLGGSMYIERPGALRKNFSLGRKDHYILGVNFGPYRTEAYFNKVRDLFADAKDICFRESYSHELFQDLPQVRFAPDIVFTLPTDNLDIKEEKRVVISVISCKNKLSHAYSAHYRKTVVDMIKHFRSLSYAVTLMSFCQYEGDEEVIDALLAKLDDHTGIDRYDYRGNIQEALNVIASCSVVVGGRFHANILGLLMNKTVIPMLYSEKTKHVFDDLGFNGLILDIARMDRFKASMLTEDVLSYRLDVSDSITAAQNHFEKLDEVLK